MIIKSWFIYIVNAFLVHNYIGYKILTQLQNLAPVMAVSVLSFTFAFFVGRIISDINMYIVAMIELLMFALFYLGLSFFFRLEAVTYVKDTMPVVSFTKRFK